MPKVALVETKPSKTRFSAEFDGLEFDQYQLCSDPNIKKVLKRDCDIDMNPDDYDWIILVGRRRPGQLIVWVRRKPLS